MVSKTEATTKNRAIASQLADLLEGYREELVASWVGLLCSMEGSHYRERPITELQASTRQCIAGLVAYFRAGTYDELKAYSERISTERVGQGFDISEVIEGHLL